MPQTYAAGDFFSEMFSAFSSGFTTVMNFITANPWLLIIVGTPVVLGLLAYVTSWLKTR